MTDIESPESINQHPILLNAQHRNLQLLRVHLGCGGRYYENMVNVDLYDEDPEQGDSSRNGCRADVIADMRNLGLPSESVDEIVTMHTIDHFVRWEAIEMFHDWHRILRTGGALYIEVADFWRCVLLLFHPSKRWRHLARTQFYGNQWDRIEYETHRYVWSARELKKVLKDEIGFSRVRVTHKTTTHKPGRDMRITATK